MINASMDKFTPSSLCAAAPERHLVSGGSDSHVLVWEAQDGKVGHLACTQFSSWTPDVGFLISFTVLWLVHAAAAV